MQQQIYFGKKFYLDKSTGYWISTTCPKIRAHVWVWKNYHGSVEKGFHIHHIDGDKSNNDIENLIKMPAFEHLSYHSNQKENKERSAKHCELIRPLTKEWHASQEGRDWHRQHAINMRFGRGDPVNYNCDQCGSQFNSTKKNRTRFCSNACKSKWRRNSGLDNEIRKCLVCLKEFEVNKYAKTQFCSRRCSSGRNKNKID